MLFSVNIEPTDYCSAKCIYCIHSQPIKPHNSKQGFMQFQLWKKIVDELAMLKKEEYVKDEFDLRLYWLGEPFLHPKFYNMLSYLFKKNIASYISIATNATHMTEEFTDLITMFTKRNPQTKFYLTFGIDGIIPTTIAKVKQTNIGEKIYKNIKVMVEKRNKTDVDNLYLIYQTIVLPGNLEEVKDFFYYWKNYLSKKDIRFHQGRDWSYNERHDFIWIKRCDTKPRHQQEATALHDEVCVSLGLLDNSEVNMSDKKRINKNQTIMEKSNPCFMPWQLAIAWDGRVTPCCLDNCLELEIGNLNIQDLRDVYFGQKARELRLAHVKKQLKRFPFCYKCNSLYLDAFTNWSVEEKVAQLLESADKKIVQEADNFNNKSKLKKKKLSNDYLGIVLISREYPPETAWGGIGTYTYHLAHGLANLGHQVHVITQSLDVDKEYCDAKVYVYRTVHKTIFSRKGCFQEFGLRLEYSQRVYQKLKEIIKKYHIDIVETPNLSAEGFVYSLFKKTPLVIRLHTHFSEVIDFRQWPRTWDRRLSCWLEDATILRSDLLICSTKVHAELVCGQAGLGLDNAEIIPLGVPLSDRKEDGNADERKNGPGILFVGRLEKRKGIHVLIRAIPYVLKEIPEANFYIVGRDTFVNSNSVSFNGHKTESSKARLIHNIPEEYRKNVHFLGYLEDSKLSKHYASCDVFVAPSLYESFGFIYIEAMSYAKPVIGCRVGGTPEVIKDGETGLLVAPNDQNALAKAIVKLIKDKELRAKIGRQALRHVEENFTRELMVENTLRAYVKALGK